MMEVNILESIKIKTFNQQSEKVYYVLAEWMFFIQRY